MNLYPDNPTKRGVRNDLQVNTINRGTFVLSGAFSQGAGVAEGFGTWSNFFSGSPPGGDPIYQMLVPFPSDVIGFSITFDNTFTLDPGETVKFDVGYVPGAQAGA